MTINITYLIILNLNIQYIYCMNISLYYLINLYILKKMMDKMALLVLIITDRILITQCLRTSRFIGSSLTFVRLHLGLGHASCHMGLRARRIISESDIFFDSFPPVI